MKIPVKHIFNLLDANMIKHADVNKADQKYISISIRSKIGIW